MLKNIQTMKMVLLGETEDPNGENQQQLANDIYSSDILPAVLVQLPKLDFEVGILLF
jgi:hypothetical protein